MVCIKMKRRMVAGMMAAILMLGSLTTTSYAVDQVMGDVVPEILVMEEENTELPYEVTTNEDGEYSFSFGDWEWAPEEADKNAAGVVSDKVKSFLNLRSGNGTEYNVIGHLIPGEEVQIISETGDWYNIVVPEKTGFVYKEYLDKLEESADGGSVDEDFMSMMMLLMMMSMGQTEETDSTITPDGNLTLVDDIGSSTEEGQQFITLVTKAGNYFYLVIDRNEKGEENVYFLNLVDEADLFALMEEEALTAYTESQNAANAAESEIVEPPVEEITPVEKENEDENVAQTKSKIKLLPAMFVLMALLGIGGGYLYLQTKKKKKTAVKPDPDVEYRSEAEEDYYSIPEEEQDTEEWDAEMDK